MKKGRLGLLFAAIIIGGGVVAVGATSAWFTNWSKYKGVADWFDSLSPSSSSISSSSSDGSSGLFAAHKTLTTNQGETGTDAHNEITITGTVNQNATYKALAWSRSWASSGITANIVDYVDITSTSDTTTGGICTIKAKKAFTSLGKARITATTFDGATAHLDFDCYNQVKIMNAPAYWDDAAISFAAARFNLNPVLCKTLGGTVKTVSSGRMVSPTGLNYEVGKCFAADFIVRVEDGGAAPSYLDPVYEPGITNQCFAEFTKKDSDYTAKQRSLAAATISAANMASGNQKLILDYVGAYSYNDYMGSTAQSTYDQWIINTVWHFTEAAESLIQHLTIDGITDFNAQPITGYIPASEINTSSSSCQM